jgi:hypothetical protein
MIISKNTHPERDLYYLGAKMIELLNSSGKEEWDYFDLFSALKQKENISFCLYSLILDWLFILSVIQQGKNGGIKKCF